MMRATLNVGFGQVIAGNDQLLLPGLQFNLGAQSIDSRSQAGFLLVGGFVVECLSALHLGLSGFHAGGGRDCL